MKGSRAIRVLGLVLFMMVSLPSIFILGGMSWWVLLVSGLLHSAIGAAIWWVCNREPSLVRVVLLWLPAMLFDSPEWMAGKKRHGI